LAGEIRFTPIRFALNRHPLLDDEATLGQRAHGLNQIDLHDKRAIVTGAAHGIGLGIAARLLASGAHCMLWDRDGAALKVARESLGHEARVLTTVVDVTAESQVVAAARSAHERLGRIDLLVNNAGIAGVAKKLWECSPAEWRAVLEADLFSVFLCCRAIIPLMLPNGAGCIVNMASVIGKEGKLNASHYSAAKAGVIGLTQSLAKELAPTGLRVNCLAPALIETDALQRLTPEYIASMVSLIPLGRPGRIEEVAAMVAWMCSDECSFSTGAVFDLSGGRATH
jgi:NAD(P)-dependent dehydrogenase (short-subunit alcohol dehydrogenase family)